MYARTCTDRHTHIHTTHSQINRMAIQEYWFCHESQRNLCYFQQYKSESTKIIRSHLSRQLISLAQHSLIQFQNSIYMLESSRGPSPSLPLSLPFEIHNTHTHQFSSCVSISQTERISQLEGPNLNCKLLGLFQQTVVNSKKETINCMKTWP